MRGFLVLAHDAPTDGSFSLDDLPGSAGRLDILCRCVTAGLLHSHGIRSDARVTTLHQDEIAVTFDGANITNLHPDERSTAARFRAALADARDAVGAIAVESAPGITVARRDLAAALSDVDGRVVQLHPDGDPVSKLPADEPILFVLSDHHPFTDGEMEALEAVADRRISLGPVALHADQAITVAHNYLDTDGYRSYRPSSEAL